MNSGEVGGPGDAATRPSRQIVAFGPFRLQLAERLLLEEGREVALGSHAFNVLLALVERRGEVVGREALAGRVWPGTTVDDVRLRVHVSALRRALSDGTAGRRFIVTLPGRGYQFVGALSEAVESLADVRPAAPPRPSGLPVPIPRMVGRADFQAQVVALLGQRRFVTIVGPGGIGKTTVAVAVADALRVDYPDGVRFLDLAAVPSPSLVPAALALALGLSNIAADPAPGILAWLSQRRALIVLDSCERVADGAAVLAEQVLKAAPGVHLLATSREPLRAEGERVLRLAALAFPPDIPGLTASKALEYPAVQLFIERSSALLDRFEFKNADAPAVGKICSRLGGIALAIELAASHVATFDLQTLATLLDDRLGLLTRGRRTALPRHQTMRAVLAWSYETLPDRESQVLRRLGVFEAAFSLQAACAVAGQDPLNPGMVVTCLGELVDKSLVSADIRDETVDYRLLDTTRAYALEMLDASGERIAVERWHARHALAVFQAAHVEWERQQPAAWLALYRKEAANALSALDWAFSSEADTELALDLSVAVAPILFEVSLVQECRTCSAKALHLLARRDATDPGQLMRLRAASGAALMYAEGPLPGTIEVWQTVLDEAVRLGDEAMQARALWALWTANLYRGESREALHFARQFSEGATRQGNVGRVVLGERIIGVALHVLGDQTAARARLEAMLAQYSVAAHRWQTLGGQIDQGTMTRSTLARVLWLRGCPDQAMALRAQALAAVASARHAISLCYVLSGSSVPVAWEAGDRQAARAALRRWAESATENGLSIWRAAADAFELATRGPEEDLPTLEQIRAALHALRATGYLFHNAWLSALLAEVAARLDGPAAGLIIIDQALTECERTGEGWCVPEMLRVRAMLLAQQGDDAGRGEAIALLDRAGSMAHEQGALAWELRIATTAVRIADPADRAEAVRRLASLLSRFGEGFGTADLVAARALVEG